MTINNQTRLWLIIVWVLMAIYLCVSPVWNATTMTFRDTGIAGAPIYELKWSYPDPNEEYIVYFIMLHVATNAWEIHEWHYVPEVTDD